MSKKSKGGYVYSTNPHFEHDDSEEDESLLPSEQLLTLHRETKGRAGKAVAIVRGFVGTDSDLSDLGKKLKSHCGTGGSAKDGEIIIQGDQREKVEAYLNSQGYKTKRVGG
ncbi:MAG: translation initiation factor [Flavobacteriales bacterium]|jgi:translation initiation factor 1|nr:translation initiation factor [Flavobacteriales bacterium]NCG30362.1 translation initiation factor [Bacteroidota bacterium]MBT4705445.1 translation initiation factor [Flavobacteriales bacterium]MBT4930444.1 translation initiation factor [Flavobacteriales bacterium]MBT5131721.1 translation initiation factor [Flavobacteriales bacterium]